MFIKLSKLPRTVFNNYINNSIVKNESIRPTSLKYFFLIPPVKDLYHFS